MVAWAWNRPQICELGWIGAWEGSGRSIPSLATHAQSSNKSQPSINAGVSTPATPAPHANRSKRAWSFSPNYSTPWNSTISPNTGKACTPPSHPPCTFWVPGDSYRPETISSPFLPSCSWLSHMSIGLTKAKLNLRLLWVAPHSQLWFCRKLRLEHLRLPPSTASSSQ